MNCSSENTAFIYRGEVLRFVRISKSSRHPKIAGNFGENLVCNWLSRSGFEVVLVDHTGLDVIGYEPSHRYRMGITVKTRIRELGQEGDQIKLFGKEDDDRKKLSDACETFAAEPWIAVYVETTDYGDLYLTSLKHYDATYRGPANREWDVWRMRQPDREAYDKDKDVEHIRIAYEASHWFQ